MKSSPKTRWAWIAATFFGAGYLHPGPGTYGSVAAVLLWLAAAHVFQASTTHLAVGTALAALAVTAAGIPAATRVARESGRKDPGFVVIDEVAGQLVALIALSPTLRSAVLGLLLFRFFDILKPWPIGRLESLPEGTGILLDDLAAGAVAGVLALFSGDLLTSLSMHTW